MPNLICPYCHQRHRSYPVLCAKDIFKAYRKLYDNDKIGDHPESLMYKFRSYIEHQFPNIAREKFKDGRLAK